MELKEEGSGGRESRAGEPEAEPLVDVYEDRWHDKINTESLETLLRKKNGEDVWPVDWSPIERLEAIQMIVYQTGAGSTGFNATREDLECRLLAIQHLCYMRAKHFLGNRGLYRNLVYRRGIPSEDQITQWENS